MLKFIPTMKQIKKAPQKILDYETDWSSLKGARENPNSWYGRAITNMQLFLQDVEGTGTLYTKAQLDFINQTTRMPVNINKIYPKLEQRAAFLVLAKPTQTLITYDEEDTNLALALEKCKKYIENNSQAIIQFAQAVDEYQNTGLGVEIVEEIEGSIAPDEIPIKSRFVSFENVLLDARAKSPVGDDWRGVFIIEQMTKAAFMMKYSDLFEGMHDTDGNPITIDEYLNRKINNGHNYETLNVKNFYEPVYTTMYLVPDGTNVNRVFVENTDPELKPYLESLPEANKIKAIFWKKYFMVDDDILVSAIKPVRTCPVLVYWFRWGGSFYNTKGLTHYVSNSQFALDRALQTFLLNGILANNKGYTSPKGAISEQDKPNWIQNATNPMALREFDLIFSPDGKAYKPEREEVQALSPFYPQIIQTIADSIDEITAMTPFMAGDAKNTIDVFSVLARYQDSAMKRIEMSLLNIGVVLENKAKVICDYLLGMLEPNKDYVIAADNQKIEFRITSDDIMKLRNLKFIITSTPDQMMPTQRQMIAKEMFNIAQTTTNESLRSVLTSEAISQSGMSLTDDLKKQVDYVSQMQQQNQQLIEQLERMEEIQKQLENRIIRAEVDKKIAQESLSAIGDLREAKGQHKGEMNNNKQKD